MKIVFFCFLLCFLLLLFFSSLPFLFSSLGLLPLLPSVFFSSPRPQPCIYRKTGEGPTLGRPLLPPPSTNFQQIKRRRQVGELWASYCAKKVGEKGKKNLLLPLPRASRGRRRPLVPSKRHPFGLLLFFFCNSE